MLSASAALHTLPATRLLVRGTLPRIRFPPPSRPSAPVGRDEPKSDVLYPLQEYPDLREFPEGPPEQPYDVAGWTLPLQMDVRVVEGGSPLGDEIRSAMTAVRGQPVSWEQEGATFDSPTDAGFDTHPVAAGILPPPGRAPGRGSVLAVDAVQNNSFRALNRAWNLGAEVGFEAGTAGSEGQGGRSGRYLISGLSAAAREDLVSTLALQAERSEARTPALARPRIGVYRPWAASMDEGWTRWVLETYDFDYRSLRSAEVVAGELRQRYDVMFEGRVLAKYAEEGSPLLSGYLLGEEHMQGYAAALEVQHGDGRVLLFGFRPQWRGQPFGTFKILFNALLYTDEVAAMAPDNEDFWQRPEEPEEDEVDEEAAVVGRAP